MKHRRYALWLLLTLMVSVVVCSCRRGTVYHQYIDVPTWGWDASDTLHFVVPKVRASAELSASIGVRSTGSYPYRMLHLLTSVTRDDGKVVQADTVYVPLYDAKGQPLGQGFPFATTTKSLPSLHVDSGYVYTYHITHVMYEPVLKGITMLGLELRE